MLEDGKRMQVEEGTPQGGSASPLLSNVYLHYVFDLWVRAWRQKQAHGDMIVVQFADNIVLGFQYKSDAERFREELVQRLRKFRLELHPDKTRLVEFGCYAAVNLPAARSGETRDLRVPRLYAYLRQDAKRTVYGAEADDSSAVAG